MAKPDLWTIAFVQEHVRRALDQGVEWYRDEMIEQFQTNIAAHCESPLEAAFLAWWLTVSRERRYEVDLLAQHEVTVGGELFRLDFVIVPTTDQAALIAKAEKLNLIVQHVGIELDGHDFHERTKEQVTRRDRRDRILQDHNWRILHFSGSEFHGDPVACIDAAYLAGVGVLWDLHREILDRDRGTTNGA